LNSAERFSRSEPKLGTRAARGGPTACSSAGQLHADADSRLDSNRLHVLLYEIKLGELLDDWDDVSPHFHGENNHLDVFVVLESVTDDGSVVVSDSEHGEKLGLGASLEAVLVGFAETKDLFDYLSLLVDLDGINTKIPSLVTVIFDRFAEGLVNLTEPMLEDISEADQDGRRYTPFDEDVDELLAVHDPIELLCRMDQQMSLGSHGKVSLSPTGHVIELAGIRSRPFI
jgi:hypothetical protein